ncbi:hypothetical protein [Chryseobacterium sp. GP-SGM7]|uniref:hypothetical protein n=1 Tax=Chryseobacterium sp. GP-SGM7 TaxID=3411323 RepID=UPI003B9433AF
MHIQIYSTLGKHELDLSDKISSWELLKQKLKQIGVFIEGMQLFIGEKKLREIYKEQLPNEDFTLFILPESTKSGLGEEAWKPFLGSVNFEKNGIDYQNEIRNEW